MSNMLQVFFDSRCPLCSREIRYYQQLAPHAPVQWVDIFGQNDDTLPAKREALLKVIHGRTPEGRVITGVDVFIAMWERLPGVWPWLGRLVSLPLVNGIVRRVYAVFARRRYQKLYCSLS